MKLVDLTLPIEHSLNTRTVALSLPPGGCTARVHQFKYESESGTYIDFPGHLVETDDGLDAASYPVHSLFQVRALVLHLDRADQSGAVDGAALRRAAGSRVQAGTGFQAAIVNALGGKRFNQIGWRSVFLASDAVEWLISLGIHLVVSDIYESDDTPQNVFPRFFKAGVATVCCPINLDQLPGEVDLTVLFPPFTGATQVPCRVVAQIGNL